jgi:hypothetical protein
LELLARLIRRVLRFSQYLPSALAHYPQHAVRSTCRRVAAMAIETDFAAETTTDRDYANQRNFYIEQWSRDDQHPRGQCSRSRSRTRDVEVIW